MQTKPRMPGGKGAIEEIKMNERQKPEHTQQPTDATTETTNDFQQLLSRPMNRGDALEFMFDDGLFSKAERLAEIMSQGTIMIPAHLRGKRADCFAVAIQALQWGLNPFVVAQKTYSVNGTLGYEAQLVIAVVQSSGAIAGAFKYEHNGNLTRAGAVLRGETETTWGEWLDAASVKTKNSPLWTSNPKQQMGYLQARNWARLYCPGAILGVYTPDELVESIEPRMGAGSRPLVDGETGEITTPKPKPEPPQKPVYDNNKFIGNFPAWADLLETGKYTPGSLITMLSKKATLTGWQADVIRGAKTLDQFLEAFEKGELE